MVKRHTTLNIEDDLMQEAKTKFLNVSEIAEKAIKDKLGRIEISIEKSNICDFCNIEMRDATKKDKDGLMWLLPFEQWICPRCLHEEIEKLKLRKGAM